MQEKQQPRHQASQAGTRRQEPIRQTATTITKLVYFAIARCGNNSRGHERTTSSPHMDSRRTRHAAGNHGGASTANDHVSKVSAATDGYQLAILDS
jgi:hypothetical protein